MCSCFEADIADDGGVQGEWFRTGGIFLQSPLAPPTATPEESDEPATNDDSARRMRDFRRGRRGRDGEGAADSRGRVARRRGRKQVRGGSIRCWASDAERHLSTGSARIRSHVRRCELTWNKYHFASCAWRKSLLCAVYFMQSNPRHSVASYLPSRKANRVSSSTVVLRRVLSQKRA